ncbi:MAG: hypothetical protein LUG98_12015 [Tannerellaceae bacterium]|nr:hypothetical protein [Tannerellaceae bacterium]
MLAVSGNFNYVVNAIVNKTTYNDDGSGNRLTTYENVNGNYNGSVTISFNSPFRNKKFTYNTMTTGNYSNTNGFVNGEKTAVIV